MSDPRASPIIDANQNVKRNLPSWMSSRDSESKSHGKKSADVAHDEENSGGKTHKQAKDSGITSSKEIESSKKSSPSNLGGTNFSKLLEGVVFVLSGFVNPERSALRSQALEMGAEYQPDWNTNCTLLVCAFPNTPKFQQVEADCGTIVSKEWILECHSQRKLVDVEGYLMYAGKPWRRQNFSHETNEDPESSVTGKSWTQFDRQPNVKSTNVVSTKSGSSNRAKDSLSPSKVKKWALDDLNKTKSWLESQEEKPEASEINKIAAEGILTCIQDAVDSLQQKQGLKHILEQWKFIPRVVEELAKLEGTANGSKEALCKEAMNCKQIYETELSSLGDDSSARKRRRTGKTNKDDAAAYDSDETIEMTEEEINLAYNSVASKLSKR